MNFSSKRHQCHQNCCLNKPYFYVKNASNTQQCSYILYIFGNHTHREKLCDKALSADNKIVSSACTATHTLCGFLLTRWLGLTSARITNDGVHIAGMISRIALQHLYWLGPFAKSQSCMLSAFLQSTGVVTVHIGERDRWHSFISSTQSFFSISYKQLSMPKDLTLSKNKCLSTSFTRAAH